MSPHKRKLLPPILVIAALVIATVTIYTFSSITAKPAIAFSRDKAIDLALTAANNDPARNATALPNVKVNALLLRIDGAGRGFVLDDHPLEDVRKYGDQPGFDSKFYNRYVWHVLVDTFDGHHHYLGYLYDIDVTDGKMIYKDYLSSNLSYNW